MTPQWHVLGVGAIGGLFACRLARGGASVTLLDHSDRSGDKCVDNPTLTLTGDVKDTLILPSQSITAPQSIEHLLVCTKSWAIAPAIASVAARLSPSSTVVVLCNGMGHTESVAPHLNGATLILGTTTAGCRFTSAGARRVSGNGVTHLGTPLPPHDPPDWLSPWRTGVPGFHWTADIQPVLLAKVALNAVINPLTAVHRVTNGALLSAEFREQTQQVIAEVQSLLTAAGATDLAEALPDQVTAVCVATAENHSSMRVDMDRAQQTEIESIVGWLLHQLNAHPPPTPTLSSLYQTIAGADKNLQSPAS